MNVRDLFFLSFFLMYTVDQFQINIYFFFYVIIQYHFIQVYILMLLPTDWDPLNLGHHLSFSFAILGWCIENKIQVLINFTIITFHVKFIDSLLIHLAGVSSYLDAGILQFICKTSLYINIDNTSSKSLFVSKSNILPSKSFFRGRTFQRLLFLNKMIWIAFIINLLAENQFWESQDNGEVSIDKIYTFLIFDKNRNYLYFKVS